MRTRFNKDINLINALKKNNTAFESIKGEKSNKHSAIMEIMEKIKQEEEKLGMIEDPPEEHSPKHKKSSLEDTPPSQKKSSPSKMQSAMSMISEGSQ